MTKTWVAVLSTLLLASVSFAGDNKVVDKTAPTTFATTVTATPAAVAAPVSDCGNACNTCGGCSSRRDCRPCLDKVKDWLCFVPLRTCPCECKHCSSCYPPLYVYFLRPCVEAKPCWHADNTCGSCVRKSCATCDGGCGTGFRLFHRDNTCSTCAGGSTCNSCTTCK